MDHPDDYNTSALNLARGRRGPASSSCAECKRLKIRCTGPTESFPCVSCIKRGISAICPNGVTSGRRRDPGDIDILRRHIQALNARVKELETELAILKGLEVSPIPSGSDYRTENEETDHNKEAESSTLVEAFGTLTIEAESGSTTWHGPFAPTINLLPMDDPEGAGLSSEHLYDESLPPELAVLLTSFPFTGLAGLAGLKDNIRVMAPSYDEASLLTELFFSRASWLCLPYSQESFIADIMMPLYASKSWELERADQISLFYGVIAVGATFDPERPQHSPIALRLHKLCAVSLALAKPLDKPTLTGLEALQSHLFFYQLSDTPMAISRYWNLSAVAFRMAQALGIHCDTQKLELDPALENRRRLLFWGLNFMDTVVAAGYGRPRFFNPRHYDCPFPAPDLKGLITYRFAFLKNAFIPVLEDSCSVDPQPTYATIMKLDTKAREIPLLDPEAMGLNVMTMPIGECMQFFSVAGMMDLVLLYLHRRFLFEAVSDEQCTDLSTHKYAFSVNSGIQSAVALTRQTRGLFWKDPIMASRLFFIWLHGFSAFTIFAAIVIKRPGCEHAETAMNEMDSLLTVFKQVQGSRRVRRCLPAMVLLREKAFGVLSLHRVGHGFKDPLEDQLEQLIGRVPVVKNSSTQDKAELDLQTLFGSGNGSSDHMFSQPAPSLQSNDPQASQWDDPLNAPGEIRMDDIDQLLSGYFNDQSGLFNMDIPDWEALV